MRPLVLAFALAVAAAGSSDAADRPYVAPRTPNGQPDLQGAWTNETLTRVERPATYGDRKVMTPAEVTALEAPGVWRKVMRVAGEPRTGLLITPDGRYPPLKAGAVADPRLFTLRPGEANTDNPEQQAIDDRCLLPIANNAGPVLSPLPNNSNYQIVQTKDEIVLVSEMIHDVRIIRLNDKHRTDGIRPWLGNSIAHWEGQTLVVETTAFPMLQAYRGSWINLKITERFTRVAADRLSYRFTVEDPGKWDRPWGGEYEMAALDHPIEEYACAEGEVSKEHMMDAARAAERDAAK